MSSLPPRRRMDLREFWFRHLLAWQNSDLNQREYCEANDLPLKRFGNWRAELRREMPPPPKRLLYRRSIGFKPRLKPGLKGELNKDIRTTSPGYTPPALTAPPQARRQFSPADKRNIVAQIDRPGKSLSGVARRYGLSRRLLLTWKKTYAPEPRPIIVPVMIVDDGATEAAAPETSSSSVLAPAPDPLPQSPPTPEVSITLKSGHEMRLPVNTAPEMIQALLTQLDGAPS